jgi:hypothetical protein
MVFLFRLALVIGSLFLAAVCFLSNITVNSSIGAFNEINSSTLPIILGLFFFLTFVNGLISMFAKNS